jgi:hypothetical protein
MNSSPIRGILFDWRGMLFHDEEDVDWIRATAASIGRDFSIAQAMELPAAPLPSNLCIASLMGS